MKKQFTKTRFAVPVLTAMVMAPVMVAVIWLALAVAVLFPLAR